MPSGILMRGITTHEALSPAVLDNPTERPTGRSVILCSDFRELNGGWYRDRTCDPYHVKTVYSDKN